jgi:hypothetical protein
VDIHQRHRWVRDLQADLTHASQAAGEVINFILFWRVKALMAGLCLSMYTFVAVLHSRASIDLKRFDDRQHDRKSPEAPTELGASNLDT